MAGRFPGAGSLHAFWDNLCKGVESITFFDDAELDTGIPIAVRQAPNYVRARGILEEADRFDAGFFGLNPRQAEVMDPQIRVFLECAWAALEDAGHTPAYPGAIAVYAGMGNNRYYPTRVQGRERLESLIGDFQMATLHEKDYIATRVSHKMNLTGPSVSVHTACSTSLVAIVEGFHNLLAYRSDMVLAGGVYIHVPQNSGYISEEGDINSRDGHCRPFDAAATGTVFGNGAGVVVLKRLADALRDRDQIYAVVRGAGLNNDGGMGASFGAPSAAGQAEAVSMAIEQAGVDPESISFIETHGTGTLLGDPIEIEALTQAFRAHTTKCAFCTLGSVKGNIGHLTAAAGVAGFIKTCLALHHRCIPPTLHFREPNPHIAFAASPFQVGAELQAWSAAGGPRRAGVSSFGIGGTNAHVILEEAPPAPPAAPARPAQVLLLSARTPQALSRAAVNLSAHLARVPDLPLADVAFTLQTGRRVFEHRRFAVCDGAESAQRALSGGDPALSGTRQASESASTVVFMFPGQGTQHVNMGRTLYDVEPVFRDTMDRCAEILAPLLEADLREILYPRQPDADTAALTEQLRQTRFAQPAIFAVEIALARLWMHWGLQPAAMIGHSVGEFAAACIGGVFSLEDGLRLVAMRGRLMQEQPGGSMLSVRLPAEVVEGRLPADLSLAADNGPSLCVVSGPDDAVDRFEAELKKESVACTRLHTSHAFHSAMMEPAVAPFADEVRGTTLGPTSIPFVSTVTTDWIREQELTDPLYWARHLREPVRFGGGVRRLWEDPARVLLEVGPGNTSAVLARQQAKDNAAQVAIASLGRAGRPEAEWSEIMKAVGGLWLSGLPLDGTTFHGAVRRRVSLPAYPFERERHWLGPVGQRPAPEVDSEPAAGEPVPEAPPDAPVGTRRDRLVRALKTTFESASGMDLREVGDTVTFFDMGLDSLFLTQIALALRKRYGVDVTFRQLLESLSTLGLLAEHLDAAIPEGAAGSADQPAAGAAAPVTGEPPPAAFGAGARIALRAGDELTSAQRTFLDHLMTRYTRRTAASKRLTSAHRPHLADPRAVSGFRPLIKEMVYPLVVNRSEGARLWDVDGNEYVDITSGFGSNFFGHRAPEIVQAVQAQLAAGYEIGPQHPLAGEVARTVAAFTGMDRVVFCNTGSEAVLGALRLARTVTGRNAVAMFSGAYHGIVDEVITRGGQDGRTRPAAPGIPPAAVSNMLVVEYGADAALDVLRERMPELAAVIVEPVQSRRPDIQPRRFLHALRDLTAEHETALIFDEVITGFRLHPGGAQAYFDVRADLATYGKVIGGGLPIGVIAGRSRFMDALDGGQWQFGDDSFPAVGVTYFAGTFVRHPLALAAARASLAILERGGPSLQQDLNAQTDALVAELNRVCRAARTPLRVVNCGSQFLVMGTDDVPHGDLLYILMREKGVHMWNHRACFITLAHTDADTALVVRAFREAIQELQAAGFLGGPPPPELASAARPPVPGARLGRAPDGTPGWYVAQEGTAVRYAKVGAP